MLKVAVSFDFDERLGFFMKRDLKDRLTSLGVTVIPLFYEQEDLAKADQADGILIPGGLSDIDPALYHQPDVHPKTKILQSRYLFEKRLLDQELKSEKPILCICWGMQMANVYFGGSLIQHLPEQRPSSIAHEQIQPSHQPTHSVRFVDNSPAISLFGSRELFVNSTHHQGIDTVSSKLSVEGQSEDGLVECVRLAGHRYFWAVQWHPERLHGDPVIPSFIKACRG